MRGRPLRAVLLLLVWQRIFPACPIQSLQGLDQALLKRRCGLTVRLLQDRGFLAFMLPHVAILMPTKKPRGQGRVLPRVAQGR